MHMLEAVSDATVITEDRLVASLNPNRNWRLLKRDGPGDAQRKLVAEEASNAYP